MSPFVRGLKSSLSSSDLGCILDVVNDAAKAYNGVIPEDGWKEPYMSAEELKNEEFVIPLPCMLRITWRARQHATSLAIARLDHRLPHTERCQRLHSKLEPDHPSTRFRS